MTPSKEVVWLLTLDVAVDAPIGGMLRVRIADASAVDARIGHAAGP